MRPEKYETWLSVAHAIAGQGTCARRRTGCVLLDEAWCVLSTGYNGPAPGQPHCTEVPCPGVAYSQGEGLDRCEAIHAEQNALLTCADIRLVRIVCCTTAPCIHCTKMLLRTNARIVYFMQDYPNNTGKHLWERTGREWVHVQTPPIAALHALALDGMPSIMHQDAWRRFNDRGQ